MNRKKERRIERRKQHKINQKLKKVLCKNLAMAPCCYCLFAFMIDDLTLEHITPLCLGGTNERSNITLACEPCNKQKGKEAWFIKKGIGRQKYGR